MNALSTRLFFTLYFLGLHLSLVAQSTIQIPSIHSIEAPEKHYAKIGTLDPTPRAAFSWMDTIAFTPAMYKFRAIQFAMAKPHYLTTSQVDYLVQAVDFPANSSEQTRAELDYLLDWQEKRTEAEVKKVLDWAKIGYWPDVNFKKDHERYAQNLNYLFFECQEIMGTSCTAEKYPKTSKLLQGIMNDMRIMEFAVKYHLLRPRPYQLETTIAPLQVMGSPSFASGHTLWAYIQAYTFGELLPEKRKEFIELAYEIGLSREIMGVHYPSDEETARQLAHRMLMLMWHTEKFQADFGAALAEWK